MFYFPPFVRSCGLADRGEVKVSVVRGATSQSNEMLKIQELTFFTIYLIIIRQRRSKYSPMFTEPEANNTKKSNLG